jgi:hypothetical protein
MLSRVVFLAAIGVSETARRRQPHGVFRKGDFAIEPLVKMLL